MSGLRPTELRVAHYDELRPLLAARPGLRREANGSRTLEAAGIPCGAVRDIAEVLADPQLDARQMIDTWTTSPPDRFACSASRRSSPTLLARSARAARHWVSTPTISFGRIVVCRQCESPRSERQARSIARPASADSESRATLAKRLRRGPRR